jgi:uncharacterized protein
MDLHTIYWIVLAIMTVGAIGAIAPGIPGPSLILVGLLIWCMATGFSGFGWPFLLIILTLIASAGIEFLAAFWGAKQVGASRWAQIGSIAGMALGLFGLLPALLVGGPLLGIVIGAVMGGFIGEFLFRTTLPLGDRVRKSITVGLAIAVGSLVGTILETVLAIAAVVMFVITTWPTLPQLAGAS